MSDNDVEYNEFTFENWYRDFCLLRYYWRERTREFQKEDDVNKKQNITTKMFQFFNEIQLRNYKVNLKDVLKVSNKTKNSDSNYELDIKYENDVVQIIKQK